MENESVRPTGRKEPRRIPRWLAIAAVTISTLALVVSALAFLSIADSEEKQLKEMQYAWCQERLIAMFESNDILFLDALKANRPYLDVCQMQDSLSE